MSDADTTTTIHPDFMLGPWLVQPELNRLRLCKTGEERALEPRIMQLLCILADNAGRVVTRESLMVQLWPRVVVNDNSLSRAVSELRKKIRCPEYAEQSFVSTVPKRGYRLELAVIPVVDVPTEEIVEEENADQSMAETETNDARADRDWETTRGPQPLYQRFTSLPCRAIAASLALVIGVAWQAERLAGIPLPTGTSLATHDADIALPESQHSATPLSAGNQKAMDWLRELETHRTGNPESSSGETGSRVNGIPAAADASTSVYSRDGEFFAYVSYTDSGSSLVLGSRHGFSPVNVYETDELIFNLQWSPVDNILLFAQKPRLSPAAMVREDSAPTLIMFNIATMQATVLQGGKAPEGDTVSQTPIFSLT